jgi:ATP/ADP translocase
MWWGIGGLAAVLYIVLIITLGVTTLRKGHWVMFIVGIFLPLFWVIGAVIPPTESASRQPA